MANTIRGELDIELNNSTYKTKLNLNSIMVLERNLGRSLIKVTQSLSTGDLQLTELLQVLQTALKGGGNDLSDADVKQIVWEAGYVNALSAVGEILTNTLTGDDELNEGKQEAVNQ
jgi:hypothetical protein